MKIIQHFLENSLRNFNYIVYSEQTKEAVFFDPFDLERTLPLAQKVDAKPKYLLKTHDHPDHIKDVESFLQIPGTKQLHLKHNEVFDLSENEKIVCLDTPGHVMNHQCFLLLESQVITGVICGDTVFNAGVGNCKNGGNPEILFETIKDIFNELSDDVKIYPSHDYFLTNLKFAKTVDPMNSFIDEYIHSCEDTQRLGEFMITTIGEEKKYNPFFRAMTKKFQSLNNKSAKELFIELRAKRDVW